MAKTRIKTFRRNSRRKRNTRRKIRGGGPISDMLPLLKKYVMDQAVQIEDRLKMFENFFGSLVEEAGIKLNGSLIKSRYIIQRKIKKEKCVKGLFRSIKNTETQSDECKAAFAEIENLKEGNKKLLTTSERFKLRHKTFGGFNSKILSAILFDSIRTWNLADNASKYTSKQNLLKFFSSTNIELPKLTEADKNTLRDTNSSTTAISDNDEKQQVALANEYFNELIKEDNNEPISSTQPPSEDVPEEHDYIKFLEIIGLTAPETISEVEFKTLMIIDRNKQQEQKEQTGQKGGDLHPIAIIWGGIAMIAPVLFLVGVVSVLGAPGYALGVVGATLYTIGLIISTSYMLIHGDIQFKMPNFIFSSSNEVGNDSSNEVGNDTKTLKFINSQLKILKKLMKTYKENILKEEKEKSLKHNYEFAKSGIYKLYQDTPNTIKTMVIKYITEKKNIEDEVDQYLNKNYPLENSPPEKYPPDKFKFWWKFGRDVEALW